MRLRGILIIGLCLLPASVLADTLTIGGGEGLSPANVDIKHGATVAELVNQGFIIFAWVMGVVSIFALLAAGFQYITAGGDTDKAANARQQIIYSIIGIIVAMSTFFIFNAARNLAKGVAGSGGVSSKL